MGVPLPIGRTRASAKWKLQKMCRGMAKKAWRETEKGRRNPALLYEQSRVSVQSVPFRSLAHGFWTRFSGASATPFGSSNHLSFKEDECIYKRWTG
jgi:hypothetical protein